MRLNDFCLILKAQEVPKGGLGLPFWLLSLTFFEVEFRVGFGMRPAAGAGPLEPSRICRIWRIDLLLAASLAHPTPLPVAGNLDFKASPLSPAPCWVLAGCWMVLAAGS